MSEVANAGSEPSSIARALGSAGAEGGERFELTALARGPWREDAAHGGAPGALLVREIERHAEDGHMRVAGLAYSFFGPVTLGESEILSRTVKPGRRQRLVEAEIRSGGRTQISVRAVLLRSTRMELPDSALNPPERMPGPETCEAIDEGLWAGGGSVAFHTTANEIRRIEGGPEEISSTGKGWFRLRRPLIPGESPTPVQRAAAAADFGNGLAHPVGFDKYSFVNCDLTVSMQREPIGEWIGLDSSTVVDAIGAGSTMTVLHDGQGRFGVATQTLFVEHLA